MALLSVDIGTAGTKALLFTETGEIITSAYQEYSIIYPKPGWAEIDAETIWAAFRKTVREISSKQQKLIKALCISCMGHNIVPVRRDGTAIRNGILAFDTRSYEEVRIIRDAIGESEYVRIVGSRPSHLSGLSKILWLKRHEPDTFRQSWKFMTFADFIRTRLGFPAVIDYTMAASCFPYDIQKYEFSETILSEFGLSRQIFSEPVPSDQVLGEVELKIGIELGLPKGVKVVAGGHDTVCGVLGAGVTQDTPEKLADTNGSWEIVAYIRTNPILSSRLLETDFISGCNVTKGSYIITSALPTSGSIVRWFRDELAFEERMKAEKEKSNPYDNMFAPINFDGGKIIALPYFSGSADNSYTKGAFLGLTLGTSRSQILQGVVEGITHEMKIMVDRLEGLSGTQIDVIRAFGGPTKSSKWLQLKADISGRRVETVEVQEASALGAAILAGVATGVYASYEEAIRATVKIKATYQPRPEIHKIYNHQHELYKKLVDILKPMSEELYYM